MLTVGEIVACDPIGPASTERVDGAVRHLLFALHIYAGYPIGSRGPYGCILDAIRELAPGVHQELVESDVRTVYNRHYGEKE